MEAKHSSQSPWRSSWSYAAFVGAAALSACVFLDPTNGAAGNVDLTDATPFFEEPVAQAEALSWTAASGVDESSVGTINPIFFDAGKSPLRFPGSKIAFNLFEQMTFLAIVDQVKGQGSNHVVATGHVEGFEEATFLVTSFHNRISGIVSIGDIGNFRISLTSAGKYRVSKLNDLDRPLHAPIEPDLGGTPIDGEFLAKSAASLAKQASRRIDVAIYFDSTALSGAGAADSVKMEIVSAIDEANMVFQQSYIDAEFNIVDTALVAYKSSGDLETDLTALQDDDDDIMDTVHAMRDSAKADIVVLVVDTIDGSTGMSYGMTTDTTAFSAYAFSVVTRPGLELGSYGFLQAAAQIFGCQFDAKTLKTTKAKGVFKYSRGWLFKAKDKQFYKTIMANGDDEKYTRAPYFSNPKLKYFGAALGTKTANNAGTIQITATTVANFKGTDTAAEVSITFPADGAVYGGTNLVILADVSDDAGIDSLVFQKKVGSDTISLGSVTTIPYRFLATDLDSGSYTLLATVYDKGGHVTTSDSIVVTMGNSGAPTGWSEAYISNNGVNGKVITTTDTTNGDTVSISARGFGVMFKNDDIQYVYKTLAGDGRIKVRVDSIGYGPYSYTTRAGLLMRDVNTSAARALFLSMGTDGDLSLTSRATPKAMAKTKVLKSDISAPGYLMMVRKATVVWNYYSTDGNAWTYLSKASIGTKGSVSVGFAVTSGDSTKLDSAWFTDYYSDNTGNNPPTVEISGIATDAYYNPGDTVTITAAVKDLDGVKDISSVKFFQNDTVLLATALKKPYTATFALDTTAGAGSISVRAYDAAGDSTSSEFAITIGDSVSVVRSATKDNYGRDGKYTAKNYGTAANFFARGSDVAGNKFRSILTFSLAGMDTIIDANLRLYGARSASDTDTVKVAVYQYNDTTWVESGKTGIKDSEILDAKFVGVIDTLNLVSSNYDWFEVDVTAMADSLRLAGETSVSFGLKAINNTATMASFYSKENVGGGHPQLVLQDSVAH